MSRLGLRVKFRGRCEVDHGVGALVARAGPLLVNSLCCSSFSFYDYTVRWLRITLEWGLRKLLGRKPGMARLEEEPQLNTDKTRAETCGRRCTLGHIWADC